MCAGDITPSPFAWYRDFNTYSTYSGVLHTCRDFEAIQECKYFFRVPTKIPRWKGLERSLVQTRFLDLIFEKFQKRHMLTLLLSYPGARERQVDDFDTKTQVEDPLGKVIMDTTGHVIIE